MWGRSLRRERGKMRKALELGFRVFKLFLCVSKHSLVSDFLIFLISYDFSDDKVDDRYKNITPLSSILLQIEIAFR